MIFFFVHKKDSNNSHISNPGVKILVDLFGELFLSCLFLKRHTDIIEALGVGVRLDDSGTQERIALLFTEERTNTYAAEILDSYIRDNLTLISVPEKIL